MDVSLKDLIYDEKFGGGIRGGHTLKCVIPGGSSVPVLLPDQLDIPASFDGIAKAGSLLGSAGIIVMDETTCMVWAAENLLHFYKHESCGKCTPCREGCDWLHRLLGKIERGEGQMKDLDLLLSISNNIMGKTLCAFGDAAATPVLSTVKTFRAEYEAHIREGRCTVPAPWRSGARALGGALGACRVFDFITPELIAQLVLIVVVFFALQISAAVLVYMERKVAASRPAALRSVPGRADGPAAAARRHPQADHEGGAAAEGRRRRPLLCRADSLGDGGVRGVRGHPVRRGHDVLRSARPSDSPGGGRRQRRAARDLRDHVDGRVRHRARGLELQQQVPRCSAACGRRRR